MPPKKKQETESLDGIPLRYHVSQLYPGAPYWAREIAKLKKPQSREMARRLVVGAPSGICVSMHGVSFSNKEETVTETLLKARLQKPDAIVLIRVGDFYEFYGQCALFAVEYAGLNPMGNGLPKAGCPVANCQETLNRLTQNGFSVLVVEQADVPGKTRKRRFVSQVVSPASPVYIYARLLSEGDSLDFPLVAPIFAIAPATTGLTVYEVDPDAMTISMYFGLTRDAAAARILRYGDQVQTVFCPEYRSVASDDLAEILGTRIRLLPLPTGDSAFELVLAGAVRGDLLLGEREFQILRKNQGAKNAHLGHVTATQIGLQNTPGIPSLIKSMGGDMPEACASLAEALLFESPPEEIARAVRKIVGFVSRTSTPLPLFRAGAPSRFVRTVSQREAGAYTLRELAGVVETVCSLQNLCDGEIFSDVCSVVSYLTGMSCAPGSYRTEIKEVAKILESSLALDTDEPFKPSDEAIPARLFYDSESEFRGRVRRELPGVEGAYLMVEQTARLYEAALRSAAESGESKKVEMVYDSKNHQIVAKHSFSGAVAARDRFSKPITGRFSSREIEEARVAYSEAVEDATVAVAKELREISDRLSPFLSTVVHAQTMSTFLRLIVEHSLVSIRNGWTSNVAYSKGILSVEGMFPYWLRRDSSQVNDLVLNEVVILTGANAGGKSTLIRSLASCVVLAKAGFMVPASSMALPDIDAVFVRTGTSDDPASGLSAFQVEMSEMSAILSSASSKSLVLIDELCKGTETNEGVAIAAAVVERLKSLSLRSIFSTHWHELFQIDGLSDGTRQLTFAQKEGAVSHQLVEGRASSSFAIETARRMGLPKDILSRAQELSNGFLSTKPSPSYLKADVAATLKNITGMDGVTEVGKNQVPPPSTQGRSFLYVLETVHGGYYVGESDSIARRLADHGQSSRRTWNRAWIVELGDKSAARRIERETIRAFTMLGIPLVSRGDI